MTPDGDRPRLKAGYNVWFGLQHVTLTGFRHGGRRENCVKCNPAMRPTPGTGAQPDSGTEPGGGPDR